jgi:hypothetical protein
MPVRPEWRPFYRSREWRDIRSRMLIRARGCCEQCGVPDRTFVARWRGAWKLSEHWYSSDGTPPRLWPVFGRRFVWIVLTVAHLDHDPRNNADENLRALCQWCHLHYDAPHHKETRCSRKDRARPLLQGVA